MSSGACGMGTDKVFFKVSANMYFKIILIFNDQKTFCIPVSRQCYNV